MRVFVTGATGFVGSALVQELLRGGHAVIGLSRSGKNDHDLRSAGATPHRGQLEDFASLRAGVEASDGVIHCGFIHDYARFAEMCELDRKVVETLGDALGDSVKPLVVTSGIGLLPRGKTVDETARPAVPSSIPRVATEQAARALMDAGKNVALVRLPPSTHGLGDTRGFVPMLADVARAKKISVYIGDGRNTWPATHRLDAARVYARALERAEPGATYHAVAEEGVIFREIAEVIGRRLGVEVVSKTPDEAATHFGHFAHFAAFDFLASSERTRQTLDWTPREPGLLEDIDQDDYLR